MGLSDDQEVTIAKDESLFVAILNRNSKKVVCLSFSRKVPGTDKLQNNIAENISIDEAKSMFAWFTRQVEEQNG